MSNMQPSSQPHNQQRPVRKSLRLRDYDYSQPGFYFVTICVGDRRHWFGDITNDEMCLNAVGNVIQSSWDGLFDRFPGLELDQFIVMPNHVHGIIVLTESTRYASSKTNRKPTLSDVVDKFKGVATHRIHTMISKKFVWQKSFYDEIIRNEQMLSAQRQYIINNPLCWMKDEFFCVEKGK